MSKYLHQLKPPCVNQQPMDCETPAEVLIYTYRLIESQPDQVIILDDQERGVCQDSTQQLFINRVRLALTVKRKLGLGYLFKAMAERYSFQQIINDCY